jgi:hypothetical protein
MNFASLFALGRLSGAMPFRPLVVLVVTFFATSSVYAKRGHSKGEESKGEESKEDLPSQARRACLSGDYERGVSILTDLFVRTKQPDWVYNQGRCLEQNARYEEAILRFEEYLRLTKGAKAQDRASAEEHIAECQSKLAKIEQSVPPPTRPETTTTSSSIVAQEPASSKEGVQASSAEPSRAEPARPRTGLRIAGIVAGVLGGASVATGVLFNLKANSMADDLNKPTGYDVDKVSQRKTNENLSWIGYGVGAACLTGGAILLYLGYRGEDSPRVALTPSVAPGQAGLNVQGVF